jgi:hypothetical protein
MFDPTDLKKAGFEEKAGINGSSWVKGNNRVEVSTVDDTEHVKYFTKAGGDQPVFHSIDPGVQPPPEFLQEFVK